MTFGDPFQDCVVVRRGLLQRVWFGAERVRVESLGRLSLWVYGMGFGVVRLRVSTGCEAVYG